jgi:hypothetical protein
MVGGKVEARVRVTVLWLKWGRVLEKLTVTYLVKRVFAFYGTRNFILELAVGPYLQPEESS